MYQFSKERADCLPASFSDNKLGLPVYKLKLNVFDIIAEIKKLLRRKENLLPQN